MKLSEPIDPVYRMQDAENIRRYIYGRRGKLTLVSPSGTAHMYTFKIPRNEMEFAEDVRFVYCIHEGREMYLGIYDKFGIRTTARSRFDFDSDVFRGAAYIVRMSEDQELVDRTPMKLYNTGICAKCGRVLDDPDHIKIGYGKKCFKRMQAMYGESF